MEETQGYRCSLMVVAIHAANGLLDREFLARPERVHWKSSWEMVADRYLADAIR